MLWLVQSLSKVRCSAISSYRTVIENSSTEQPETS